MGRLKTCDIPWCDNHIMRKEYGRYLIKVSLPYSREDIIIKQKTVKFKVCVDCHEEVQMQYVEKFGHRMNSESGMVASQIEVDEERTGLHAGDIAFMQRLFKHYDKIGWKKAKKHFGGVVKTS